LARTKNYKYFLYINLKKLNFIHKIKIINIKIFFIQIPANVTRIKPFAPDFGDLCRNPTQNDRRSAVLAGDLARTAEFIQDPGQMAEDPAGFRPNSTNIPPRWPEFWPERSDPASIRARSRRSSGSGQPGRNLTLYSQNPATSETVAGRRLIPA
jgi:hypothetical protein